VDLEFVAELKGHSKKVTAVLMEEGSGQLFTGSHDSTVRVWSCATGQVGKRGGRARPSPSSRDGRPAPLVEA
jgi:WD40 repeat protein